jgi:hypothetical protein
MLLRSCRTYITCMVALCAVTSSTVLVLFAGIAAACGGTGGGGGCPAPSVSTGGVDSITSNSATLTGSVNPQGCQTYFAFEYGRSSEGYPNEIGGSAGSGTSPVPVQNYSSLGLQPSTSYHYRLTAWNAEDEVTGSSGSFTTKAACTKPTVTTNVAGSITHTSAVLSGSVNPNGCQATSKIEWGPSSNPTAYPNVVNGPSGAATFNVSHTATGLQPGTGYHYRISATNSTGTTPGPDRVFTTPKTKYVALGDSYSSGLGIGHYYEPNCKRSSFAYPELLAYAHPSWTFINRTCWLATTNDITNVSAQSSSLTSDVSWVSYTIGGNDAGFENVLEKCAIPLYNCSSQLTAAENYISGTLPGRLDAVNNTIKARSANAKVIVLNYPLLFNGKDCTGIYSESEQLWMNQLAIMLRGQLRSAAERAGSKFIFKDVIPSFMGHAVCDGGSGSTQEWINGASWPVPESYHPNIRGQEFGYYPAALSVTG